MRDLLAGDDSDDDVKFKVNENYASKYSQWREKEFMQHKKDLLKSQGISDDSDDSDESSSSEDDEDAKDLDVFEKDFFKVLSCLKKKDPSLYEGNTKFGSLPSTSTQGGTYANSKKETKNKKYKPFVLRDYERNLILEREGKLSDDDEIPERDPRSSSPTYVEEQKSLKESFKQALENSDAEEEQNGIGNLFKKKKKTNAELQKEEEDYKEWLKGRKEELKDKSMESELKVLHDYWNDPDLSSDEVFLRDYILNNKFRDPDKDDFEPTYNEIVHDSCVLENDEDFVDETDDFERKYNFRFEEPDQEFIKSYPRSVETSLRRKDDRRKIMRQEKRERKEAEMAVKREEIKQLKALKKKEILNKIKRIQEITGNDDLPLQEEDIEEDFSPEKHDQKMKELFNDNYYEVEEDEKPECLDLENDLEIENWENWRGKNDENDNEQYSGYGGGDSWDQPQSEDPNFNMDCDYDPKAEFQDELVRMSKSRKKQRRRSKLAEALAKKKPVFDPSNEKFEEYFDEYYKLDCEDIIGDLPCRFKYRKTTPNDYGLTVDEILRADVKELNKWCSLKKVVKYKPDHVEKYEVQDYRKKARNEALKRKMLPSLYSSVLDDNIQENGNEDSKSERRNMKKRRKSGIEGQDLLAHSGSILDDDIQENGNEDSKSEKRKMKKKRKSGIEGQDLLADSGRAETENDNDASAEATEKNKKKKKKRKHQEDKGNNMQSNSSLSDLPGSFVDLKKRKDGVILSEMKKHRNSINYRNESNNQVKRKKKQVPDSGTNIPISDTRLKAYGIRPKKFKNKIKYGNKQNMWN